MFIRGDNSTPTLAPRRLAASFVAIVVTAAMLVMTGCSGKTLNATNVTATSATLNAQGQCDNSCNVQFRYRVDEGRWTYTPYKRYPSSGNSPPVSLSSPVSNLSPGTTYNYQVCGDDQGEQGEVCVGPNRSVSDSTSFTTPASSAPKVKLMTYNVAHYSLGSRALIADEIAKSGATIVALQETTQLRGQSSSEAARLAGDLGWNVPGETHAYYKGWTDTAQKCAPHLSCLSLGNAIISKYPIVDTGVVDLYNEFPGTRRNLIRATIQVGSKQLWVYATHLAALGRSPNDNYPYYDNYTTKQLDGVMLHINGTSPASQRVLMGDFNLPYDSSRVSRGVFGSLDGYHDWKVDRIPANHDRLPPTDYGTPVGSVCASKNPVGASYAPCTYPASSPTDKRDYIWAKGYPLAAGYVPRCPSAGCNSDHRPYWTEIIP